MTDGMVCDVQNGRTPLKLATFTAYWHQEAAAVIQGAGGKAPK